MQFKKGKAEDEIVSHLGEGTELKGELSFNNGLRVDGVIKGKVRSEAVLEIGPAGKVDAEDEVRDAGLISAAQRVEHYERAGYGCARTYAELLGDHQGAQLLQTTLTEESDTDKKLTKLAESVINVAAG